MRVFLIGFMGCGKSTKAKQLANLLTVEKFDTDNLIEKSIKMSISEYFSKYGEDKFRQLESQILKTNPYPQQAVIATGGGLPCYSNNMEWMNQNGITIYLKMKPKQLVSRLANREKRPLIKDLNDDDLLKYIQHKLEVREHFYNQATYIVDAFNLTGEELFEQIKINKK